LLLWITSSLSPSEIRERVMAQEPEFCSAMIAWLESCQQGEFNTGELAEIGARIKLRKDGSRNWEDPTCMLPPPPKHFRDEKELSSWYQHLQEVADEVVFLSNQHDPKHSKGCIRGPENYCRARFPREIINETHFDKETGAIHLRKREAWINTFSNVLSYLLRCNTDVTSLLSGSAARAVIMYISDYVTKSSLKTYSIFESVRLI
ncbi:hypothetical protein CERSUDRAFT_35342, partial [Gelatoporia subvermispora B]